MSSPHTTPYVALQRKTTLEPIYEIMNQLHKFIDNWFFIF